jgi:hypothetical protein
MSGALKQVQRRLEAPERQLQGLSRRPAGGDHLLGGYALASPTQRCGGLDLPVSNHPRLKAPTQAVERACRSLALIEQPL